MTFAEDSNFHLGKEGTQETIYPKEKTTPLYQPPRPQSMRPEPGTDLLDDAESDLDPETYHQRGSNSRSIQERQGSGSTSGMLMEAPPRYNQGSQILPPTSDTEFQDSREADFPDRDLNVTSAGDLITDSRVAEGARYQLAMLAECANGRHHYKRKYGKGGIAALILIFPLAPLFMWIDHENICTRCKKVQERFKLPESVQERVDKAKSEGVKGVKGFGNGWRKKEELLAEREDSRGYSHLLVAERESIGDNNGEGGSGSTERELTKRGDHRDQGQGSPLESPQSNSDGPQTNQRSIPSPPLEQDSRMRRRDSGRFSAWSQEE